MLGSKVLFIIYITMMFFANITINGNKITEYDDVCNYINIGGMLFLATFGVLKRGEEFVKSYGFELIMTSCMLCGERIVYYNNSMDLDYNHYVKILVFFMRWWYVVEEKHLDLFFDEVRNYFLM